MSGRRKLLSPDHIRALIKEAIGIIEGDHVIQAEAAAEIAAIEAAYTSSNREPRSKRPTRRRCDAASERMPQPVLPRPVEDRSEHSPRKTFNDGASS